MKHFGEHLMVDMYEVSDEILMNKEVIEEAFKNIIKEANMKTLSEFNIYEVENNENSARDFGGVTAFQVINESHMSVHTFAGIGFISMDLYTCKRIDMDIIIPLIKKYFKTENLDISMTERGLRFNEYLEKYNKNS